jgi:hypothetical protein
MTTSLHSRHGKQLLARLEQHWQARHPPEEVQRQVQNSLRTIRQVLSRNTANTRIITMTFLRLAAQEELAPDELEAANRALRELLKTLGVTVVGILPGSFITLPGLFALARHFDIELLPESSRRQD